MRGVLLPLGAAMEVVEPTEGEGLGGASVRLVPGVMNEGRIENREELVAALRSLRVQILGAKAKRLARALKCAPDDLLTTPED